MGNRTLAEYTYSNDRNRQLLSLDYGNGDEVQYTYDEQGRVIQETYEDGDTVTYTYDNAGGIATVTDSSSKVKSEVMYSAEDQLSRYTETGGDHDLLVRYKYDTKERLQYILYMVDNNLASKAHNSEYAYDNDNRITSYRKGNGILAYTYEKFDRIASTQLTHKENSILNTEYTFYTHGENQTSYHVSAITHTYAEGNTNYTYTYDANGNILSVSDGTNTTSYVYDSQNQLIRENNQAGAFTHTWTYDPAGNILTRSEYAYTTGSLDGLPAEEFKYVYLSNSADAENKDDISTDNAWGDTLLSYNGHAITYDAIGNPLTDGTWNYTWKNGRELASMTDGTETWNFTYKADGLRTQRTNGTKTYDYVYCGNQLMYMQVDGKDFLFSYTPEGVPMGITYLGTAYYYLTNLQGDVVGILNNQGELIVSYSYDAWGNILATQVYGSGTNRTKYQALANYNPLRYRGYIYDVETSLYYVSSRYYNAELCRWISPEPNIDYGEFDEGTELLGYNVFAYCANNPVNNFDPDGEAVANIVGGIVGGVTGAALGYLLAKQLGLKGWKKTALIAAATAGGAVLGAFLGPYVAKLAKSMGSVVKSTAKKAAKSLCFVAGTLVETKDGHIPIETVQVGDYVYAENPETGEKALKRVVQTFVNQAEELVHVNVNGEQITTTPGHPFYVQNKGWIGADRLTVGDVLVTRCGERIYVKSVRIELAETPVKVYNFEVEDFHTYFVGEESVLVHNKGCSMNTLADSYIKKNLKLNAHAIKREYLGKKAKIALYDLAVDKATGIIYIVNKAGEIITQTIYKTK